MFQPFSTVGHKDSVISKSK